MNEKTLSITRQAECEGALRRAIEHLNYALEDLHGGEPQAYFESLESALDSLTTAQRIAIVSILSQ